jgi:hypothetical protein
MTEKVPKTYVDFVLPPNVVSKVDVSHLVAEFERVDNELTAIAVRAKTGSQEHTQPVISQQLADFMEQNKLSFDDSHERTELVKQMQLLKDKVPIIHMTFAVTADRESLEQLAAWLRASIHPQATIAVGLQPALVAGVYLRTPNHVHDLSLRGMLTGQHKILVDELETLRA